MIQYKTGDSITSAELKERRQKFDRERDEKDRNQRGKMRRNARNTGLSDM